MTALTSRHVIVFTTLLVHSAFVVIVCGGPVKEPSLSESIKEHRCIDFPPADLKIPSKCSESALSTPVDKDLLNKDGLAFYLCAALLDSTKRLCPLVNNNKQFRQRVEKAFSESITSILSISDDKFCAEMNYLDPNTTMEQAKFVYEKLEKTRYCTLICGAGKDDSTAESQPLCKSIQFAHQQIHVASELQKSLNKQAHTSKGIDTPPELKPAVKEGGSTQVESDTRNVPSAALLDPKDSVQRPIEQSSVQREESRTIETKLSNEKQPSQSAPSQIKGDPGSSKSEDIKSPTTQAKASSSRVIAPAPLQLVADEKTDDAKKSPVKPPDDFNFEERTEVGKEENNLEAKHDDPNLENMEDAQGDPPVDMQNEAPQENQNDGQLQDNTDEDNVDKPEEDEDIVNGAQEPIKEMAEKPPAVDTKKASSIDELPTISHPKMSVGQSRTSSQFGNLEETEDSHFFAYFLTMSALCTLGYLVYHNKRKIIAMAVEGKKGRNQGRRRPNSASYHKLDSNLEEAMSSNLTSTNSYVIY